MSTFFTLSVTDALPVVVTVASVVTEIVFVTSSSSESLMLSGDSDNSGNSVVVLNAVPLMPTTRSCTVNNNKKKEDFLTFFGSMSAGTCFYSCVDVTANVCGLHLIRTHCHLLVFIRSRSRDPLSFQGYTGTHVHISYVCRVLSERKELQKGKTRISNDEKNRFRERKDEKRRVSMMMIFMGSKFRD